MNKLNTVLILIVFLTSIISGCGITGYTIVKEGESEKINTEEKPKQTEQEILVENVKTQGSIGQQNTAPTIRITQPDNNEIITSDQFEIWWKSEDPNNDKLLIKLEYQKEGNWILIADNIVTEGSYSSFLWDLKSLSNGRYNIKVTVTDGRASDYETESFEIKR